MVKDMFEHPCKNLEDCNKLTNFIFDYAEQKIRDARKQIKGTKVLSSQSMKLIEKHLDCCTICRDYCDRYMQLYGICGGIEDVKKDWQREGKSISLR